MNQSSKIALFWSLFCLGTLVSLTNVFAPVHELGHIITAWWLDGEGSFKDWNHVNVPMNASHAIAGWNFEVGVFCIVGWFVGWIGGTIKGNQWHGAFWIGHAFTSTLRAPVSYDMNGYLAEVALHRGVATQDISAVLAAAKDRWIMLACIWMIVSLIIVIRWHKVGLR